MSLSIDKIEQILPQTQCRKCGYPNCRAYAEAVVKGESIEKCLPGGINVAAQIAHIIGKKYQQQHDFQEELHRVVIKETECIGCTRCLQVCPVDAIIGASKQMHTVIIDDCTGCDLCIDSCPIDCIEKIPVQSTEQLANRRAKNLSLYKKHLARTTNQAQKLNLQRSLVVDQQKVHEGQRKLVNKAIMNQYRKLQRRARQKIDTEQKNKIALELKKLQNYLS